MLFGFKINSRVCLNTFPHDSILSMVDFAENYTFQEFNEIQKMHWHSFQFSILVHIYYHTSGIPTILTILNMVRKLLNEYHYYILDDSAHDTLFVQHYFELHWLHLTSRGFYSNNHLVWSDGYAT